MIRPPKPRSPSYRQRQQRDRSGAKGAFIGANVARKASNKMGLNRKRTVKNMKTGVKVGNALGRRKAMIKQRIPKVRKF